MTSIDPADTPGHQIPADTPGHQIPGVPTDNVELQDVLDHLAADGYTAHLFPGPEGTLRCGGCDHVAAPEDLVDVVGRRLEGASDPDDMSIVVAARCPDCATAGTVVLSYGPGASEEDADVLARLPNL